MANTELRSRCHQRMKSVGNCVPHSPTPLRGFLWRCGGAPQNAGQSPRAPNARPHALARVAEIRGARGNHSPALLGDVESIVLNATQYKTFLGAFMMVLLGVCCWGVIQAFALEAVTVQGGGMAREVSLGMTQRDLIATVGAPSRIKSEGHCFQYDTFDMSVFLDRNMKVNRIYLGKDFRGSLGGSHEEAQMNDVYRDYGSPNTTERLTYTPSPSIQTRATVELEDKVSPRTATRTAAFPMGYRGDKALYELYSHDMVMKYKYVSDTQGIAFWMNDRGSVYATVLYPSRQDVLARIYLESVHFDFDKYNLKKEYIGVLDRNTDIIKKHDELVVTLEGNTDSKGSIAYNQKLSERRAKSVYDFLVRKGVPPSQLKTVGYSESHPVASNSTKEGRAENRRVDFDAGGISEDPVLSGVSK